MIYGDFSNKGPELTGSVGTNVACAIYESTLSDMAMFNAMMKVDAYDIKLNEAEANGTVDAEKAKESKAALAKGAAKNIFDKIASAFEWLAGKIIDAFNSFKGKILTLFKDDTKLIAKYEKPLLAQADKMNDIKIKWYKPSGSGYGSVSALDIDKFRGSFGVFDEDEAIENYSDDASVRRSLYYTAKEYDYFNTTKPVDTTIKEVGGISAIINFLKNTGRKNIEEHQKVINGRATEMRKQANEYKRQKKDNVDAEKAAKMYKMYQAYKDCTLKSLQVVQSCLVKYYKQHKAAFTKAVGSLAKTESTILDFIVSEAMYAVDDAMESSFVESMIHTVEENASYTPDSYTQESADLDFFGQPIF